MVTFQGTHLQSGQQTRKQRRKFMGTRVPSDLFLRFDNPQLFTRNGYSRFVRKCRSRRVEEFLNLSNIPGVRRTTRTECGRFGSSKRLKHKNGCKFARRSDGTRVRTNVFLLFLPRVRCWSVTTFSVYSCQISCDFHRLHERISSNVFQTLSMHV